MHYDHFDDDDSRPECAICPIFWWCVVLVMLAIIAVLIVFTDDADAHKAPSGMEYDGWCCNGDGRSGDCQPIPSATVKPIDGGYQITLHPGDHTLVTKPHIFTKKQSETRWSTDGQYHACLYPNESILRCFYAPPPGV